MIKRNILSVFIVSLLSIFICSSVYAEEDEAKRDWFINSYTALLLDNDLGMTLTLDLDSYDAYLTALTVGKRIGSYKKYIDAEVEGQIVKYYVKQDHWEFNAAFVLRWQPFLWDKVLDTSFAVGNGFSYTSKISELEEERHGKATRLLHFLMFELTFALPDYPKWNLIARIHHRSGVYGVFDGVSGGTNAVGLGIKYFLE